MSYDCRMITVCHTTVVRQHEFYVVWTKNVVWQWVDLNDPITKVCSFIKITKNWTTVLEMKQSERKLIILSPSILALDQFLSLSTRSHLTVL